VSGSKRVEATTQGEIEDAVGVIAGALPPAPPRSRLQVLISALRHNRQLRTRLAMTLGVAVGVIVLRSVLPLAMVYATAPIDTPMAIPDPPRQVAVRVDGKVALTRSQSVRFPTITVRRPKRYVWWSDLRWKAWIKPETPPEGGTSLADAAQSEPPETEEQLHSQFAAAQFNAKVVGMRAAGGTVDIVGRDTVPTAVTDPVVSFDLPDSVNLGGPSAGLALALDVYLAASGKRPATRGSIVATGEIDMDGFVTKVGDVPLKGRAALDSDAGLFIVPKGQGALARRYAPGLKVVEVQSFEQAVEEIGA
jgi:hypothetical protein